MLLGPHELLTAGSTNLCANVALPFYVVLIQFFQGGPLTSEGLRPRGLSEDFRSDGCRYEIFELQDIAPWLKPHVGDGCLKVTGP